MQDRFFLLSKGIRYVALCIMVHCVVSCASQPKTSPKLFEDGKDVTVRELEARIKNQERTISKMREAMVRLKMENEVSKLRIQPHPKPKEQRKILTDETSDENFVSEKDINAMLGLEEESIADSSQESMHLYYEGLKKIEEKKFDEAVRDLRQFIENNPQHVYADRAQFLITEAYFKSREFGLSVVAATLLETRYPYSLKLPETLYKKGVSFVELNQKEQARLTFLGFLHRFPHDPLSAEAKKEIAKLSLKNK